MAFAVQRGINNASREGVRVLALLRELPEAIHALPLDLVGRE